MDTSEINGYMSDSLRKNLSQLFEEATKSYEHHQQLMNDARMTIDACRAALEHLEKDQPVPATMSQSYHG